MKTNLVQKFEVPRPESFLEVQVLDVLDQITNHPRSVAISIVNRDERKIGKVIHIRDGQYRVNVHPTETDHLVSQIRLAQKSAWERFTELWPKKAARAEREDEVDLLNAARAILYGTEEKIQRKNKHLWKLLERAIKAEELRLAEQEDKLPNGWFKVRKD